MQEGVPSCSNGTVQGKRFQENLDLGKLWTVEGIGHSRQEDDPQYGAGDTIARDTTRTMYKKPVKDGRSGRDVGRARKCNSGIRDLGLGQQLRLKIERT
jgi:hypothetical protein